MDVGSRDVFFGFIQGFWKPGYIIPKLGKGPQEGWISHADAIRVEPMQQYAYLPLLFYWAMMRGIYENGNANPADPTKYSSRSSKAQSLNPTLNLEALIPKP